MPASFFLYTLGASASPLLRDRGRPALTKNRFGFRNPDCAMIRRNTNLEP